MKKFIIGAAVALTLVPQVAYAKSICVFSDAKKTKCEIPLCLLRGGMGTEADCNPALVKMIVRAIFQKPPVPLPPSECNCSWIKPVVIPADQYGIPLFADVDMPNFLSSIGVNIDLENPMSSVNFNNFQRQKILERAMSLDLGFQTTCLDDFKRSKRDMSCFIKTGIGAAAERIDIDVDHKKYGKPWRRKHQYIYKIKTMKPDGQTFLTELKLRHKKISYCRTFINGIQTSDDNCNAPAGGLPGPDEFDPSLLDDYYPELEPDPIPIPEPEPEPVIDPDLDTKLGPNEKIPNKTPDPDGIMVFQ